ncbi:MAG TPA: HAD family phosphatase [Bacteroidia bacterium]|nr:HAD family phosphatase [Bacteroidia bacterium]
MIRNIIFDLGGVIINLDTSATMHAFQSLGMKDFGALYTQSKQAALFDDFDRGKISAGDFRNALRQHLPPETTDAAIDAAWNAMLADIPVARLQLLENLKTKYRIFLLSNTNEIHVTAFSAYLQRQFGFADFSRYFEGGYYSCRIGKRKPDADAFLHVIMEHKLNPTQTLFIDDSRQHVEGALRAGLKAAQLKIEGGEELISFCQKLKL